MSRYARRQGTLVFGKKALPLSGAVHDSRVLRGSSPLPDGTAKAQPVPKQRRQPVVRQGAQCCVAVFGHGCTSAGQLGPRFSFGFGEKTHV